MPKFMKVLLQERYLFYIGFLIMNICLVSSCKTQGEIYNTQAMQIDSVVVKTEEIKYQDSVEQITFALKPKIFNQNVKSAYLSYDASQNSNPIYRLNSNEYLHLYFDYLKFDHPTFLVDFVHCDHNWIPSSIEHEYFLEGDFSLDISNGNPSFNTQQDYVHFEYTFPNENFNFLVGGNYYLILLHAGTEDTVLQLPFHILDNQTTIKAKVREASIPKYKFSHQRVEINIDAKDYEIQNPYENLIVQIRQNNRQDKLPENIKPSMVYNNTFEFANTTSLHFEAGKEFKYIDTRSLQIPEARIEAFNFTGLIPKLVLNTDEVRSFKPNISLTDMNGRFVIYNKDNTQDHVTSSDYAKIFLRLEMQKELVWEDIYVVGSFNNWQIYPEYKLNYSLYDKSYQIELLLKQGYYNYEYVIVPKGKNGPTDKSYIEGNDRDTENDYFIYVYTKPIGENYMNLIGLSRINSRN